MKKKLYGYDLVDNSDYNTHISFDNFWSDVDLNKPI